MVIINGNNNNDNNNNNNNNPRHVISFQSPWKQEDLGTLNHPNLTLNSAREFPKLHSNHWKHNFFSKGCPYRCREKTN